MRDRTNLEMVELALKLAKKRKMWDEIEILLRLKIHMLNKLPLIQVGQGEYIKEWRPENGA